MAKVLFTDKEKKIVVKDLDIGSAGDNEVKIRTEYSYISAGTELTMLQMGRVNSVREVGSAALGYSLSGYVVETGANVSHVKEGDKVVAVGQGAFHADEVLVPGNLVVKIPEGCSMRAASMVLMGCFALEGVRKAQLEFGENVLIIGGGLMGQFACRYAALSAGTVILLERNIDRLKFAADNSTALYSDEQVWDKIRKITEPVGIEKVLFCMGGECTDIFNDVKQVMTKSPDGITQGTVVFSGGATITVSLASPSGNLRILSSAKAGPGYRDKAFESGHNYPEGYVKWTVTRNVQVILNAMASGKLELEPLITGEYHYLDALTAYQKLAEHNTKEMAVLLRY